MNAAYTQSSGLNKFWMGFLLGMGLPVLCLLLYCRVRFPNLPTNQYIDFLIQNGILVHVMSLSIFINSLPFMFFVYTDRFKSGRGIMTITIFYAILIFVLKFVMR
jgi:hypothetical protein